MRMVKTVHPITFNKEPDPVTRDFRPRVSEDVPIEPDDEAVFWPTFTRGADGELIPLGKAVEPSKPDEPDDGDGVGVSSEPPLPPLPPVNDAALALVGKP